MHVRPRESIVDSDGGFTLIEVLASLVILGIFVTTLLSLMYQLLYQSKLTAQKQQAILIGRNVINQMAETSATSVIQQGDTQKIQNGVTYHIHPSAIINPPSWAQDAVSQGAVYAEVFVSWTSLQAQTQSIDVKQLLPH